MDKLINEIENELHYLRDLGADVYHALGDEDEISDLIDGAVEKALWRVARIRDELELARTKLEQVSAIIGRDTTSQDD